MDVAGRKSSSPSRHRVPWMLMLQFWTSIDCQVSNIFGTKSDRITMLLNELAETDYKLVPDGFLLLAQTQIDWQSFPAYPVM